jgi:hypothetical protein
MEMRSPTIHARVDDVVYLHGSPAAGLLRDGRKGVELCGTARRVVDEAEKRATLEAITEHVSPGRWRASRRPTVEELRATEVLAITIDTFSAKERSRPPPIEESFDLDLDVWSGIVPLRVVTGEPIPA